VGQFNLYRRLFGFLGCGLSAMSIFSSLGSYRPGLQRKFSLPWVEVNGRKRTYATLDVRSALPGLFRSKSLTHRTTPTNPLANPSTRAGRPVCQISLAAAALRHHFFQLFLFTNPSQAYNPPNEVLHETSTGTGTAREEQTQTACEAVSPLDEPCNEAAIFFCDNCERWFCIAHARMKSGTPADRTRRRSGEG